MNRLLLWIAQGFYVGRAPVAPGTFGSFLGLAWLAALLALGFWGYCLGTVAAIFCSVWICGKAEQILGQTDPSSVVLDEIIAVPLCFAAWLWLAHPRPGGFPGPESLFNRESWLSVLAILLAFRFFDIVKPWPVRQSQSLPGGWGVTLDDVLAAVYVNIVVLVVAGVRDWMTRP